MIKRLIATLFFIKLLLLCSSTLFLANAQNFNRFSNKEGFNQNTIYAIAQDNYGFLWFGTPNGLIKYDDVASYA
ncbi:MAG: two-component regulator propeller domain-containing protein [Algibacter sp.]|uniref:two-component regulator propeller domain-containing protein n=1 Tax=Algibacter sp. TaxID=1872428 RepID=UPI00329A3E03